MAANPTLLIPIENQVRELDAKLLLASIAAPRGFHVILGSRTELDFAVGTLPRGIYLSKSLTRRSLRMFEILHQLGFRIAAWDEEAVVHYPDDIYFSRRLDAASMAAVDRLFAWGVDNQRLWSRFPAYDGTPISVTGNPRGDLLRPEFRAFLSDDADEIRKRFGEFLLVNTNFGSVNAFHPNLNFSYATGSGAKRLGTASVGMPRQYAEGRAAHKRALLQAFLAVIPKLAALDRGQKILVRPHPTESRQIYDQLATRHTNIEVVHGGSVLPWLLASQAVIHNGCTTAVEAFALGIPALAFQPIEDPRFDEALPNALSNTLRSEAALLDAARSLAQSAAIPHPEQRALFADFIDAQEGPLASDRIVDILLQEAEQARSKPPSRARRLAGRARAARRWLVKRQIKGRIRGQKHHDSFQRHRFPGVSQSEIEAKLARFAALRASPSRYVVEAIGEHLYSIRSS